MKLCKTLLFVLFFLTTLTGRARAISLDARKIAMGGTLLPYHSESYIQNPAYLEIQEDAPLNIPIPLGLFAFLGDIPNFDPDNDEFDALKLVNLMINPPFYLELIDLNRDETTEILIDIAEDKLIVDLDNLKEFMPKDRVDTGLFDVRQPRVGATIRDIHLGVSPFLFAEGEMELSENLERALADAQPFEPNTDYIVDSRGSFNLGMAINAGYVWDLSRHVSSIEGPRVLFGLNGKYLMGFVYSDVDIQSTIHTFDPLFNSDNPPEFALDALLDTAYPEEGDIGPKGHGIGFDTGLLLRYSSFDIGFGIQDLYTYLNWRARRERHVFDEEIDDLVKTVIFDDRSVRADIPRTFSFTFAYRNREEAGWRGEPVIGDYILASNLEIVDGDLAFRLGGETYYGPGPIALRFGTYNQGKNMQLTFGAGIPLKYFNFDIAFATHSSSFQQQRGLTLATSISFP